MLVDIIRELLGRRSLGPKTHAWQKERKQACPICGYTSYLLDSINFGRTCIPSLTIPSNEPSVDYLYCPHCRYCFAPDIWSWTKDQFKQKIYNDQYVIADPDYLEKRPSASRKLINQLFPLESHNATHLDFGGGNGKLSHLLTEDGWTSFTFDPMQDERLPDNSPKHFGLITAFEVFEHAPYPDTLLEAIKKLTHTESLILFTTLISDNSINPKSHLDWWYAAPRNGHISLFSSASLKLLLNKHGFNFLSLSEGVHLAFQKLPAWAANIRDKRISI